MAHARDHPAALLGQLAVLAQGRQLAQVVQAEEVEELLGRAVEQRPTDLLALAQDAHQAAVEEQLERRARVDATDLIDLGARDGLAVGDDRQGLELGARQPHRSPGDELLHPRRERRVRAQRVAAGDRRHHDAGVGVRRDQRVERGLDARGVADPRELAQTRDGERAIGGEQERLDERAEPLGRQLRGLTGDRRRREIVLVLDRVAVLVELGRLGWRRRQLVGHLDRVGLGDDLVDGRRRVRGLGALDRGLGRLLDLGVRPAMRGDLRRGLGLDRCRLDLEHGLDLGV